MNERLIVIALGTVLFPIGFGHFIINVHNIGIDGILIDGIVAAVGIFSILFCIVYLFTPEESTNGIQKLESGT